MSDNFKRVRLIKADGKYVFTVFTGIDEPMSEWEIVHTETPGIAMIHRDGDPMLDMLKGIFPDIEFTVEHYQKYKPCGCSVAS